MSFCDCSHLKNKFCMLLRKYGCWLVISILLLPVLIAVLIYAIDLIIRCFDSWSQIPELKFMKYEYKINVVDMVAAIGLIIFGYLTYKNQLNNEFYSLFNTLLNEHNRLLKDLLESKDKKEKVDEINQSILLKILFDLNSQEFKLLEEGLRFYFDKVDWKNYAKFEIKQSCSNKTNFVVRHILDWNDIVSRRNRNNLEGNNKEIENLTRRIEDDFKNCLVCNLGSQELQLQGYLESEIKYIVEIKPYLIILFRLLKCISTTKKIDNKDKSDYYALVRGLIPMEILLLILFNSQVWLEKDKGDNGLNYKKLLKEAELFEHLPIEDKILQRLLASDWLDKFLDRHKGLLPKGYMEERFFISILNNGEFIDEKAFGDSVYVKKYKEKASKT